MSFRADQRLRDPASRRCPAPRRRTEARIHRRQRPRKMAVFPGCPLLPPALRSGRNLPGRRRRFPTFRGVRRHRLRDPSLHPFPPPLETLPPDPQNPRHRLIFPAPPHPFCPPFKSRIARQFPACFLSVFAPIFRQSGPLFPVSPGLFSRHSESKFSSFRACFPIIPGLDPEIRQKYTILLKIRKRNKDVLSRNIFVNIVLR